MKKILMMAFISTSLVAVLPAQASLNLVVDGGFETGSFSPAWVATGATYGSVAVAGILDVHSGTYAVGFGPGTDTLSQTLTTVVGQAYDINFWLDSTAASVPFTVTFGGITLSYPPNPLLNTGGYQDYDDVVVATSTSTILEFCANPGDPTYQPSLDDVSVTAVPNGNDFQAPVPEPTTVIAGAMLLLPFGAGLFRSLRKEPKP